MLDLNRRLQQPLHPQPVDALPLQKKPAPHSQMLDLNRRAQQPLNRLRLHVEPPH
jgi:hypothetical protein